MMPLTDSQKKAVNVAHKPLFIQAGAGTGKTFTLTKRLAHGLSAESGPLIGNVGRLLTITFTNKAAAELIGRVRTELRARNLSAEALQVDAAWISTIHAMCHRMLLGHAFDVGIDPGASLLTEDETSGLAAMALDQVLRENAGNERLELLFSAFEVGGATRLISDLSALLALAPDGVDDFDRGPAPVSFAAARRMLQDIFVTYQLELAKIEEAGLPDKQSYIKSHDNMAVTVERLRAWLEEEHNSGTWADIDLVLSGCPVPSPGNLKEPFKSSFAQCKGIMLEARAQASCALAYEQLDAALGFAAQQLRRHRQLKLARGVLDTNDLLIATYSMLAQDEQIASEYRGRFDSIMVDEFQDTDALQVGIVRRICDEGLSTLTTVGDAQQSIYGFRGADLEVYRDMRSTMKACDSEEVELTVNYRSQPDILRFVQDIFAKPDFFGAEFLKVSSGRDPDINPDWLEPNEPRVKILLSAGCKAPEGRGRSSVESLRKADARSLADEFERLHEQGAHYGDMAILLRSTKGTYADAYLDELRARGIPCVVSGGSDFFTLPEVSLAVLFLRYLADCDDDEALFGLLGSDFFTASDDDLLVLSVATRQILKLKQEEARSKPSLNDALAYCVQQMPDKVTYALVNAFDVLQRARVLSRRAPLSQVLRQAVVQSGWQAGLRAQGVEGGSIYANIERVCDMLDDFEKLNGHSLFSASEYFRDMLEYAQTGTGARSKLGTLVSSGNVAVQVMTIHSSKGLEFPIVAVAEFEKSSKGSGSGALLLTEGASRHITLGMNGSDATCKYLINDAAEPEGFSDAMDTASFRVHAYRLSKRRDEEEQQRLLYVALTRARDELIVVAHDAAFASTAQLGKGLTGSSLRAVFGEEVPSEHAVVKTGSGALVELSVTEVPYGEQPQPDKGQSVDDLLIRHIYIEPIEMPRIASFIPSHEQIRSYSSIAKGLGTAVEPVAAEVVLRDRSLDTETASTVGSAFHLAAQWLAQAPAPDGALLEQRLHAIVRRYRLNEQEQRGFIEAIAAWMSSSRFTQIRDCHRRHAEYAFCTDVEGFPLEGRIDLLCFDDQGKALVIDYKTGTSGQGNQLRERYALQAHCYAYALLKAGICDTVELVFVRPQDNMDEIVFTFAAADIQELAKCILSGR